MEEHELFSDESVVPVRSQRIASRKIIKDSESESDLCSSRAESPPPHDNQEETISKSEGHIIDQEQVLIDQQLQSELDCYIAHYQTLSKMPKAETIALVKKVYRASRSRSSTSTPDPDIVRSVENGLFATPLSPQKRSDANDQQPPAISPQQKRKKRLRQLRRQLERLG